MCSVDVGWWVTFGCIVGSGAFGGLARFCWDCLLIKETAAVEELDSPRPEPFRGCQLVAYIVIGVAAAFLVPLFLSTISSTLLDTAEHDHLRLFVLIGFCVAAAMFAKQFIGSIGKKALKLAEDAEHKAVQAIKIARSADASALKADNRAIALIRPQLLIERLDFDAAEKELAEVLLNDPMNVEAFAWRAYCLKRLDRYGEAVDEVQKALRFARKDVYVWLYNLACYQTLAGHPVEEVVGSLERAVAVANKGQTREFVNDLQGEEDFANLRGNKVFDQFVQRVVEQQGGNENEI